MVATLFDQYRQFYGLAPDFNRARHFIGERLVRNESVIFLAVEPTAPLAAPPVETLTRDSTVDRSGEAQDRSGRALGFVQLFPSFSSLKAQRLWVLNDLFVAPEGRGKGVGRALMERARRHAEETGACRLTLETMSDNQVAKALYRSLGYVHEGGEVEHYTLELE
jgi:ribosomal protein S18 acetylase RimI-like enzyme